MPIPSQKSISSEGRRVYPTRACKYPTRATQASPPCSTPPPPLRERAAFKGRFQRGCDTCCPPIADACTPPRATQASPPCSTPPPPLRELETWQPSICV